MNIRSIRWVGVKTDRFAAMGEFAQTALGLAAGQQQADFLELLTPNGDRLELNGPSAQIKSWEFRPNHVMIGFLVDSVADARKELEGVSGVELLGEIQSEGGFEWQDFRAPDGNVYELTSEPKSM